MAAGTGWRLLGLLAFAGLALPATPVGAEVGFTSVDLQVSRLDSFEIGTTQSRFGVLEFRGGLQLSARDPNFGALSGLDFAPDGTLIGVSDTGYWFAGRLINDGGRLVGMDDARIAPILNGAGRPVNTKRQGDAEALRITAPIGRAEALVSFEQRNEIRRFVASPDLAHGRPERLRLPKGVDSLHHNDGIEGIAVAPTEGPFSGALVLLAEHSLDRKGNHRGWIASGPRTGPFSLARSDEFDVTDAAFLPNSDLLILERRFSFTGGIAMRIRRIAAADLLPGATVEGRVLLEADMRFQIDNMEGMALRPGANGETLLTLCSDDNHSILQRTILLEFALPADAPPAPRRRPDLPQIGSGKGSGAASAPPSVVR